MIAAAIAPQNAPAATDLAVRPKNGESMFEVAGWTVVLLALIAFPSEGLIPQL